MQRSQSNSYYYMRIQIYLYPQNSSFNPFEEGPGDRGCLDAKNWEGKLALINIHEDKAKHFAVYRAWRKCS